MAASKDEAVALARAMIVDGRMPSPEAAKAARAEYEAERRKKREQQPAQIRKREAQRRWSDALWAAMTAEEKERELPTLYETIADVFDLSDPELWKSNSFASLRPRLVAHVQAAVAKLARDIAFEAMHGSRTREIDLQRKLDRAREILAAIEAGS